MKKDKTVETEFLVSISIDEFASLWGPIWAVPADYDRDRIQTLYTERGIIIPIPSSDASATRIHNEMEPLCHWYKVQPLQGGEDVTFIFTDKNDILSAEPMESSMKTTFSLNNQLLLGVTSLRVNKDCVMTVDRIQKDPATQLQFLAHTKPTMFQTLLRLKFQLTGSSRLATQGL